MKKGVRSKNTLMILLFFLGAAFILIGGTKGHAQPRVVDNEIEQVNTEHVNLRVVQVIEGLEHPWAIAWLPDGRMLVSERPGRLHLVDGENITQIEGLPKIHHDEDQLTAPEGGRQGGLLDVAVHPDYENNGWIYFTYSSPGDDDSVADPGEDVGTGTALARGRLNDQGTAFTDIETIYSTIPRTEPGRHYGSRIVFPDDASVMFSIGDRGLRYPSQDLTNPAGSMIRLRDDGGAHPENPFIGVAPGNLRPEIYSYGHRNNQGLVVNPQDGEIWTTEHGPQGGDLLHRVEEGANYGWPQVAYGVEYSTGEHIGIGREAPGVQKPVYVWEEAMAPSGLTFYYGDQFPEWQGNLFAGSLLKQEVYRLELDNGQVVHQEPILTRVVGRIRDVREGPDGFIYVATDEGDGGIYRIEPVR
jgi:aldose sugar dehydrogenase